MRDSIRKIASDMTARIESGGMGRRDFRSAPERDLAPSTSRAHTLRQALDSLESAASSSRGTARPFVRGQARPSRSTRSGQDAQSKPRRPIEVRLIIEHSGGAGRTRARAEGFSRDRGRRCAGACWQGHGRIRALGTTALHQAIFKADQELASSSTIASHHLHPQPGALAPADSNGTGHPRMRPLLRPPPQRDRHRPSAERDSAERAARRWSEHLTMVGDHLLGRSDKPPRGTERLQARSSTTQAKART